MESLEQLNAFNSFFGICLSTPPDEAQRVIMAHCVRTTLKLKVDEVESLRNDITAMLGVVYPTHNDVKTALENHRRYRDAEKKAVDQLQKMITLLEDFGFNISEWSTTPTPLVIPTEADQTTPPTP